MNPNRSQYIPVPLRVRLPFLCIVMYEVPWVDICRHPTFTYFNTITLQIFISPLIKSSFISMIQRNHRCYPLFMLLMAFSPLEGTRPSVLNTAWDNVCMVGWSHSSAFIAWEQLNAATQQAKIKDFSKEINTFARVDVHFPHLIHSLLQWRGVFAPGSCPCGSGGTIFALLAFWVPC